VAFVSLLRAARIELLVDVPAHPVSRRHPQFSPGQSPGERVQHILGPEKVHEHGAPPI
jgi:hypothetical protein